ncbi:MAG TPA: hypothetical protein VJQ52_20430, partial [Steroidobacteraceae bacterium]|nr:hypothetical protein [Steroidobacteraceae bacterium]
MPAITRRILAIVIVVGFAWPTAVFAKDEHRKITTTWRLYGAGSGDFSSPQSVIDAFNARSEALYAQCISNACGSCTRIIHDPPTVPGPGMAKVNGVSTFLGTSGMTSTYYAPACNGQPPVGPTVTYNPNIGIAASAVFQCPTGWSAMSYNQHYETVNGIQNIVYDLDCVRFVPDCPDCARPGPPVLYGAPIDAVGNAKIKSETDYASADGLLRVSRDYSSQAGRWSWNHDVAITDFTGRSSVRHDSVALNANVRLIPEGLYTGAAPAAVDRPTSFQLTTSPASGTPPQVWVTGARGARTVFTESGGTFATTAISKPQLTLIAGPGGTQRWLLRNRQGRFDLFDLDGHLLEEVQAHGRSLTYAASASTLTVTANPGGRQLVYSRTSPTLVAGAYDTVTLPDGHQLQYAINGVALVTAVTYPDATSRTYLYDEAAHSGVSSSTAAAGRLTGQTDENQVRYATYKYDSAGPISTELAGAVDKFTLNTNFGGSSGSRQIQRPPSNATETLNWDLGPDGERRVTSRWLPAGAGSSASTKSLSYDASGLVTTVMDDRGNRTCYANDSAHGVETVRLEGVASGIACPANLAAHTIPANTRQRKITTQWHLDWNLPIARAEPKRITTWVYNGQPDPFAGGTASCAPGTALLPDGAAIAVVCKKIEQATTDDTGTSAFSATSSGTPRSWTYTYNAFGQVLTADGPRTDVTDVTTYTYYTCSTGYQCGQLASVTNAAGHATTYDTYNAHGQPLTITDPNGVVTTLTYDLRQRLTSRTVGLEQTTFDYWPTGLLKKTILPDGSFLEYTYDAAHRLTGVNDAEGNRIAYTLDTAGNRTKEEAFDPLNALATTRGRAFDALSRISQEIGAAGTAAVTTSLLYDNNGNTRGVNAPLSRNTVNAYDELDRLTQVTDPATGLTKYGYDGLDQLISVTDPRSKVTSYTYNGLGDLTQQVSPDTGTTANTYDSGGNLVTRTDARSKTATYAYDALNRVTSVTYPDQTIGYTYDSGTNQKGRLTQVTDASGSTTWSYDTHGRVLSRQQSMGVTKSIGYAYDSAGRLQTFTLPSGSAITYGYTDGRVTSLLLNGSSTILSNVLYQPFGPMRGWTWGNSTLAIREYDTDGKVTDIDSAGLK